jgi:hypothetical protein
MGGGKFGKKALSYLKAMGAKVLVTDTNPKCGASLEVDVKATDLGIINSLEAGQSAFLVGDAVEHLLLLLETNLPDLVVTAIPGNAVARVVEMWLSKRGYNFEPNRKAVADVIENIPKSLVSFVDIESAVVVVSYMPSNMRCRENCLPPKGFCAVTGRPKLATMNKLLQFSVYQLADISQILTSHQLTGGLGAINGKDLCFLLKHLETLEKNFTLAIGTACDCHGVINLAKVTK